VKITIGYNIVPTALARAKMVMRGRAMNLLNSSWSNTIELFMVEWHASLIHIINTAGHFHQTTIFKESLSNNQGMIGLLN